MEEIKLTPLELKKIIDNAILVAERYYSSVFTYQDKLIKLDKILYSLLKRHPKEDSYEMVNYRYLGGREDFNNQAQIEELVSRQKKIKLTRLPLGIVTLKDVDSQNVGLCPGIIIPYLKGYSLLEKLPKNDLLRALKILKNLLLEVRELENNGIYQEDMYHLDGKGGTGYNIMYQGVTPQLIDMSGEYVKIDGNKQDKIAMYDELGQVIIDFFDFNGITPPYNRWYTDDYEKNVKLVKALERKVK